MQRCLVMVLFTTTLVIWSAGCTPIQPGTATAANVVQPVQVGPVDRIGGTPGALLFTHVTPFDIEARQSFTFAAGRSEYGHTTTYVETGAEGANKFDVELSRVACPRCPIVVDHVPVGSYTSYPFFGILPVIIVDRNWVGLRGVVLPEPQPQPSPPMPAPAISGPHPAATPGPGAAASR